MTCTFDYVAFENDTFDTCPPVTDGPGGWGLMRAAALRRDELRDEEDALLLLYWSMNENKEI